MKVNKTKLREDLLNLIQLLEPYGITKADHVAKLQHEEDNPDFPSGGYVRRILAEDDPIEPSTRFCTWFYHLKQYVESNLANGDGQLILSHAQAVGAAPTYRYVNKLHFVVMPKDVTVEDFNLLIGRSDGLTLALIPSKLRRVCRLESCGRAFPGSPSEGYCCDEHRREAKRLRRKNVRGKT